VWSRCEIFLWHTGDIAVLNRIMIHAVQLAIIALAIWTVYQRDGSVHAFAMFETFAKMAGYAMFSLPLIVLLGGVIAKMRSRD
jgi:hypothetical protein